MDADAVWELTEHLSEALRQLKSGERPAWQQVELLQRDVEVVRAELRGARNAQPDLAGLLGEIDQIAVETSRHGSAESLAVELIRMRLDPVFKRGTRKEGIAALKKATEGEA